MENLKSCRPLSIEVIAQFNHWKESILFHKYDVQNIQLEYEGFPNWELGWKESSPQFQNVLLILYSQQKRNACRNVEIWLVVPTKIIYLEQVLGLMSQYNCFTDKEIGEFSHCKRNY